MKRPEKAASRVALWGWYVHEKAASWVGSGRHFLYGFMHCVAAVAAGEKRRRTGRRKKRMIDEFMILWRKARREECFECLLKC